MRSEGGLRLHLTLPINCKEETKEATTKDRVCMSMCFMVIHVMTYLLCVMRSISCAAHDVSLANTESGVSTGGSSVQSMLELKMWRRASMSRIEFNQGQKQKVSKMFRNVSPTTTQKHRRSRAKEADYDILGGISCLDYDILGGISKN
jgi:hypothetical protein